MPGDVDLDDLPYEDILSDDVELEMKKERESRKRRELLAKVDFSRYTDRQTSAGTQTGSLLVSQLSYSVRQQMKTESHGRQKCCQFPECTETRAFI